MKEFIDSLSEIEQALSLEKGPFNLFALFLREDAPQKWDLLVSSQWIENDRQNALKIIAERLQNALNREDILKLSRIVIINQDNPALEAVHQAIQTEHSSVEIRDSIFFGLQIKHGYLITSKRVEGLSPV